MIPELGHMALILAVLASFIQSLFGLRPAKTDFYCAQTQLAAYVSLGCLLAAFLALAYSFAVSDFSVLLVALHSHSLKPLLYKIAALWGNHEGSLLLWLLVLAAFGGWMAVMHVKDRDLQHRALGVQGLLGFGFGLFALLTSNPFARVLEAPFDGNGLNPVLQDPGLAFHPPTLYIGYVGFSSVFSLAAAGLIEGRITQDWARTLRLPATLAWTALSAGIAGGAWWAFYELGWGGWWFWDPVENASLLPWLAGTALLHSLSVLETRGALKRWTVFLAIIAFCLSLLGTFLVRSGVLSSVHAFANDPARGIFVLALLGVYGLGAFALYAWRAPSLRMLRLFTPISREGSLVANNLLLVTMAATVLLGTLYPIFAELFKLGQVSVGAPYFNAVMLPLALPLLLVMGFSAFLPWKRSGKLKMLRFLVLILAAVFAVAAYLLWQTNAAFLPLVGFALALWVVAATALYAISTYTSLTLHKTALILGHAGLGLVLVGAIASGLWKVEDLRVAAPHDRFTVGQWQLEFKGVETVYGENFAAERATVMVRTAGGKAFALYPQKRWYPVAEQTTSEAAIHTRLVDDIYVVLGDAKENGAYVLRTYSHPLIAALWAGFLCVIASGFCSVLAYARKRGAP